MGITSVPVVKPTDKILNRINIKFIIVQILNFNIDRGQSKGAVKAFREDYGKLSELRSLVRRDVPFVAMTATATQETRNVIICDLSMTEPVLLLADINRPNIRYSLVEIDHKSLYVHFKWIIDDLE